MDAGGGLAGGVRALDVSGAQPKTLWAVSLGRGSSYGQTTLTPDGLVLGVLDNALFGVRDGKVAWRFKIRSMLEVTPALIRMVTRSFALACSTSTA